jgi:SNF2 family DNA or RNA helicase
MDSGSESILIFAWHREVVMGLAEKLKAPYIIGGMDKHLRDRHIASFQSGKTKILIGNIDSMGEGHNLQTGTRVIFAEYSWTESKNTQCEKRIHRKGQTKKVFCEYIVLPDSLDEVVLNVVFNKAATIKKIVG